MAQDIKNVGNLTRDTTQRPPKVFVDLSRLNRGSLAAVEAVLAGLKAQIVTATDGIAGIAPGDSSFAAQVRTLQTIALLKVPADTNPNRLLSRRSSGFAPA